MGTFRQMESSYWLNPFEWIRHFDSGYCHPVKKVMIIGNAGGGKSTLSNVFGEVLGIPVYSIDRMQINPGWIETEVSEFIQRHDAVLERDSWIIDGLGPIDTVQKRIQSAEMIIFIDFPLYAHFSWTFKRLIINTVYRRPYLVANCPQWSRIPIMVRDMLMVNREWIPRIREWLDQESGNHELHVFHSRHEYLKFLKRMKEKTYPK